MYSNIPVGNAVLNVRVRGGVVDMKRTFVYALLVVGLLAFVQVATADYYTLIVEGNVVMPDGSPPPKTVGIERVCSDIQASAPGPLTDKKGHYTWRMDLDPTNTRVCFLRATLPGFSSSRSRHFQSESRRVPTE